MFKRNDIKTKLLSLVLSAATVGLPITYAANSKPENSSKIQKNKSWIKKHRGKLGIAAGTLMGSIGLPVSLISFYLLANKLAEGPLTKAYIEELETKFGTLSENQYTPKQRGTMWCWAACLEGLYNYYKKEKNIENNVTQEDIVTAVGGINPLPLNCLRLQGLPANTFYLPKFFKEVNSLNDRLILKTALIKSRKKETIKNSILNYYDTIGKVPFSIDISTIENLYHFINITNINSEENKITIEDPAIGMSYTTSFDNFIETQYVSSSIEMPAISMMSIVDKNDPRTINIPTEIFYTNNTHFSLIDKDTSRFGMDKYLSLYGNDNYLNYITTQEETRSRNLLLLN